MVRFPLILTLDIPFHFAPLNLPWPPIPVPYGSLVIISIFQYKTLIVRPDKLPSTGGSLKSASRPLPTPSSSSSVICNGAIRQATHDYVTSRNGSFLSDTSFSLAPPVRR